MNGLGIVVIDMQQEFIKKDKFMQYNLIEKQLSLINFAKSNNIPLFALEYINYNKTIEKLRIPLINANAMFIEKYNDNAFIKLPNPRGFRKYIYNLEDGELLNDSFPDGNYKPYVEESDLNSILRKNKIQNLVLTGIHKDACVLRTAKGAKERGYSLMLSKDITDDGNSEYYDSEKWYSQNTNYFVSLDDLVAHLTVSLKN